jgi:hypothetical protein
LIQARLGGDGPTAPGVRRHSRQAPHLRCTSEARPQLLGHDLDDGAGAAVLSGPGPLLEPWAGSGAGLLVEGLRLGENEAPTARAARGRPRLLAQGWMLVVSSRTR